ncbi:MAG: polysaccharide deacetylase family protein [Terriglobales bacterium]
MMASLARSVPEPVWRALATLPSAPGPYCIVAFHRIAFDGEELSYSPRAFSDLCRYWRDHYLVLPLDSLLARLARLDPACEPAVTITFDDGYADNAEVAAEILDRFDLSATFFITAGVMGEENRFPWDAHLARPPRLMDWRQVQALHRAGFRIGSHTLTHARLSVVRGAELAAELRESRARLEQQLGEPVLDFAYPYGGPADCDAPAREAVRAAGYRCCLACHGGLAAASDSPFALPRLPVSPFWHATPRAWARAYTRLRWRTLRAAPAPPHW